MSKGKRRQPNSPGSTLYGSTRTDVSLGSDIKISRGNINTYAPLYSTWDDFVEISPEYLNTLKPEEIAGILKINSVARNAVEYPAADCLRNWFYIVDEGVDEDASRLTDKKVHEDNAWIQDRLRELEMHKNLYQYLVDEAATGSAIMYMDVNTATPGNISNKPLDPAKIKKVNFLNTWNQFVILRAKVNNFLLDKDFGKIESFTLKNNAEVHNSRVKFLSTRPQLGSVFGHSVLVPLELALDAQRTLIWSIGEIAHSMLFKVLKTKNVDFTKINVYKERVKLLRETLATNDLVAIDDSETLEFKTPGDLPRVQEMSDILWEMISCSTRVPKSILLGKTEGKVAGAEYDHISYYIRLVALQRIVVEPVLKWVIDALFKEKGTEDPKYKIIFKPLWDVSDEMDAKIRKLESEVNLNEAKTEQILKTISSNFTPGEAAAVANGRTSSGDGNGEGGTNGE
jgi:phage-related protein (TIGR01555 family)